MTENTAPAPLPLWADDNGRIACVAHSGAYLAAAVEQKPHRSSHRTPRGTFDRVANADANAWVPELGPLACETCKAPAALPRVCYYIDPTMDGPIVAEEGIAGYSPTTIHWPGLSHDARKTAVESLNRDLGLTPDDVMRIVASSMAAGRP